MVNVGRMCRRQRRKKGRKEPSVLSSPFWSVFFRGYGNGKKRLDRTVHIMYCIHLSTYCSTTVRTAGILWHDGTSTYWLLRRLAGWVLSCQRWHSYHGLVHLGLFASVPLLRKGTSYASSLSPYDPSLAMVDTYVQLNLLTMSTSAMAWNVSGGTVRANISKRDLSLSALAVDAGEIWGMRNRRSKLATWKVRGQWQGVKTYGRLGISTHYIAMLCLKTSVLLHLSFSLVRTTTYGTMCLPYWTDRHIWKYLSYCNVANRENLYLGCYITAAFTTCLYGYWRVRSSNDPQDGPGRVVLVLGLAAVGALVLAGVEVVQRGLDELQRLVQRVRVATASVQDVHAKLDATADKNIKVVPHVYSAVQVPYEICTVLVIQYFAVKGRFRLFLIDPSTKALVMSWMP